MSKLRQAAVLDRSGEGKAQIATLARDYPAGHAIRLHFHHRDQLVYAARGVMTVQTSDGTWVVPPHRAVWIPAAVPHAIAMSGAVAMRTLYVRKGLAKRLPRECRVINVSALLKQLILDACRVQALSVGIGWQRHLVAVLLDQLEAIQLVPLQLPHVSDPRAVRVAEEIITDPGRSRTLEQICATAGASKRTMERLFFQDAGMTFGKWRQQVRLMHAMRLLADGAKVTHAALEAGYATPSAFISMFHKALGTTPTSYFRGSERSGPVPRSPEKRGERASRRR